MNALAQIKPVGEISTKLIERASEYAKQSTAGNTRKAYQADLDAWAQWAKKQGQAVDNITEITAALWLTDTAEEFTIATLKRRIAGLSSFLRASGRESLSFRVEPLKSVWAGISRTHGKPQTRKLPITTKLLRDIVRPFDNSPIGLRNRALMVLGFAGAMRRADIAGLDFGAGQGGNGFISFEPEGLLIQFVRSKTNQDGKAEHIGIAYGSNPETCPVRTLQAWRDCVGGEGASGPIFRKVSKGGTIGTARLHPDSISRLIKTLAKRHFIESGESEADAAALAVQYSGHSLRAGFVTTAFEKGVPESAIMPHTRHKQASTLYKYRRMATVFQDNPSAMVGL